MEQPAQQEKPEKKETFWKRARQRIFFIKLIIGLFIKALFPGNYLKKIEGRILIFRVMDHNLQRKNFNTISYFIEDALTEGGFDNKVRIKYFMRFVKTIKTFFALPDLEPINRKTFNNYSNLKGNIDNFVNELHGVEKIKEDIFLNTLSHEEQVVFNECLASFINFLYVLVVRLEIGDEDSDKNFFKNQENLLVHQKNIMKEILDKALQKITEQEKINKLKIASKIFKDKAKQYRWNAIWFMCGSAVAAGLAVSLIIKKVFKFYYIEQNSYIEVNNNALYVHMILDALLSGRLLLSIIALTGFLYCLRFYAANQHNAIICEQRANTLESFEALYENVGENKGKNEEKYLVVQKVLQSATEHLPTGFSKLQSDSGGGVDLASLASLLKLKD